MQYYEYRAFTEMEARYIDFLASIEAQEGVIPDEVLGEFLELDFEVEASIFRAWNTMEEYKATIVRRKQRIELEKRKNEKDQEKVDFFKSVVTRLLKEKTRVTGSNTVKIGEANFILTKSKAVEVDDQFEDARFTTWELASRVSKDKLEEIKKIEPELKFTKSVDKNALTKALKSEEIEGARMKESDKLTVK